MPRHFRAFAPALVLPLALIACSPDDSLQGLHGADGGTPDAGAAASHDLVVTSLVARAPRRGPIVLAFDFADPDGDVGTGHAVEWQSDDGKWNPASVQVLEEKEIGAAYLWDSFADVNEDRHLAMRLVARDPDGDVALPFEVDLRNAPDTDRTVVVAHEASDEPGGGVTDKGNEVSVLVWKAREPALSGPPRRLTVGVGPRRVRAAPHGRAMAVLEQHAGTIGILATPLTADASAVELLHDLTPPSGYPSDAHWSHDGRFLFVLTQRNGDPTDEPRIWRYTPSEDLSRFEAVEPVTTLPGPPMRFDVAPNGDFLVVCGSGGSGLGKVLRYDAAGHELGRVEDDYGPPNSMTLSPAGNLGIMTSDLFGEDLRLFSLSGPSLAQVGAPVTTVHTPDEVVFHPASTAERAIALVANVDKNSVTPLVVTPDGVTVGTPVKGLSLATDMDVIERGSQAGTVIVSTLTKVSRVALGTDGTAVSQGAAWDFGDSTGGMTYGIGIQR